MRGIAAILLLLLYCNAASAQISPVEGRRLNYRRIGFSVPANDSAVRYRLLIAKRVTNNEDTFKKYTIRTLTNAGSYMIAEVPDFNEDYTWRMEYINKKGKAVAGAFHHFSTGYVPAIDSCEMRLRVITPAKKFKDHYMFIDGQNVLYDMNGRPVWYLPVQDKRTGANASTRDMKLTPQGTLTFLLNQHAYEVNYDGDTLWKGPDIGLVNDEDSERYHHELTRLANGHYMVLGTEHVVWDHKVVQKDTGATEGSAEGDRVPGRTAFGTIIEYDTAGNVVWSWKSSRYFMNSDIVNYVPEMKERVVDVHENAFFFDEKNKFIYISYRNISRILKVSYPDGNVVNVYGEIYKPGVKPTGNGLFCEQHGVRLTADGKLMVYNNNACNDERTMPTVIVMKETDSASNGLVKTWEYECNVDGINVNPTVKKALEKRKELMKRKTGSDRFKNTMLHVTTGGNVYEMPDHSFFVFMNTQYGKTFIVNKDKQVLWSAVPEKWNPGDDQWYITNDQYRASIISREQLDRFIRGGK
jgi:Arylsulfotransferase (ASST)